MGQLNTNHPELSGDADQPPSLKAFPDVNVILHAANAAELPQKLVELVMAQTNSTHGALFLWDSQQKGLVLTHHRVEGLEVTVPNEVVRPGARKAGVAMWVFNNNKPYISQNTDSDPHYTRYLVEVGAIAAVPIRYQKHVIGVLTVSNLEKQSLSPGTEEAMLSIATDSAKFLRRLQMDERLRARTGRPFLIKGLSESWLEVERRIEQASPTTAPVLIRGESGTGKDLVANAIHFNSNRSEKPLITVNCAAIPEALLESILFGHVKGAFTGASNDKIGEFQKADGGTLFLDEVGELPLMLQAKVLRAVEHGEVQIVGSNDRPITVDVRLVCATNRDLDAMSKRGDFRADLYYRLSVMTMELPPLREYKDVLRVLSQVFLAQAATSHGRQAPKISSAAMALLQTYSYPGNVRELKNALEHATIMCRTEEIQPADLPKSFQVESKNSELKSIPPVNAETNETLVELREAWLAPRERNYLTELLRKTKGNVREAARRAGVNPVTFYRLLKKRDIQLERSVSNR